MKPHVARFEEVEVNERLVMEDDDDADDDEERVLLKMQMREGENRTQTFALMFVCLRGDCNG